ncbi:hypothetical protein [Mesorhizobium sp.]|uniref:ATP-dependent DNA ligase n=1 Tax=Mesorhizobium sp. TaxID=1871066 RepID=UPI0025F1D289|nr:hypothetical protein [Mesorhizobium sp.]
MFTRNGMDWTTKYPDLVETAKRLVVESAIIDGEIIVPNEAGLADFAALRKAMTRRQHDLYFVAFDLLHFNGNDLRDMPSKYRSARSINWLRVKCYTVDEFELLGVEREAGKPAFALMGEIGTRKYVGSAFINPSRAIRERLWLRVQEHAGPPPKGMKRPATQWVKPGLIGRVKHLRGQEDLRHASLQNFARKNDHHAMELCASTEGWRPVGEIRRLLWS